MNKRITLYESTMCCASGVCGPSPDQVLMELGDALEEIRKLGSEVERYSITQSPKKFRENPQVIKLIQEQQLKALPITTLNGNVIKVGSYPTLEELKSLLQDGTDTRATTTEQLPTEQGCCSGQDFCDIRCSPNYRDGIRSDSGYNCCST